MTRQKVVLTAEQMEDRNYRRNQRCAKRDITYLMARGHKPESITLDLIIWQLTHLRHYGIPRREEFEHWVTNYLEELSHGRSS